MLIGLCYRALAGSADPGAAELTARRIEHAQAGYSEAFARVSSLRGDLTTAQHKATEAQREARQAELDLQLYDEAHPPPPKRRGLLAPRLTQQQSEETRQRAALHITADLLAREAREKRAAVEQVTRQLATVDAEVASGRQLRDSLGVQLQSELAASALDRLAAGHADEAQRQLADARRLIRGDLMTAVLLVLVALFGEGDAAARAALIELRTIFAQHNDPLPRVLEALIALHGGARPGLSALGLPGADQFSQRAHYNLYLLAATLGGLHGHEALPADDPLAPTLQVLAQLVGWMDAQQRGPEPEMKYLPAPALAELAAGGDALLKLLCAHLLLQRGELGLIAPAAGIDLAALKPPRKRNEQWPGLLALVAAQPLTAWPRPLAARVQAALACHVLLAAQESAPPPLCEAWLAESYGWPKDYFYWWTLATLKQDPALLRNAAGEPGGVFEPV
jgi:hypothetical protein